MIDEKDLQKWAATKPNLDQRHILGLIRTYNAQYAESVAKAMQKVGTNEEANRIKAADLGNLFTRVVRHAYKLAFERRKWPQGEELERRLSERREWSRVFDTGGKGGDVHGASRRIQRVPESPRLRDFASPPTEYFVRMLEERAAARAKNAHEKMFSAMLRAFEIGLEHELYAKARKKTGPPKKPAGKTQAV